MKIKRELAVPLVFVLALVTVALSVWFSGHVRVRERWTWKSPLGGDPRDRELYRDEVVRLSSGASSQETVTQYGPAFWEHGYDRNKDIVWLGTEQRLRAGFGPAGPDPHGGVPKSNYHVSVEWRP